MPVSISWVVSCPYLTHVLMVRSIQQMYQKVVYQSTQRVRQDLISIRKLNYDGEAGAVNAKGVIDLRRNIGWTVDGRFRSALI